MSRNYNLVAPFYDALAGLVFGEHLLEAQCSFLHLLPKAGRVMIVGGGSGKILQALGRTRPHLEILYVEASSRMVALAQKQKFPNKVQWFCQDHLPGVSQLEAVIFPFFLDQFLQHEAGRWVQEAANILQREGQILFTDFFPPDVSNGGAWKQRLLLWGMYRFFRIFCGIPAQRLPDWEALFSPEQWTESARKEYLGKWVTSKVYRLA